MADLNRLHDFASLNGLPIVGQDVDDELDQLVARLNDVPEDSLLAALAEKLGVSQTGTVRRGKSIVATEQSRSGASFGLLTTPDRVDDVELPTDGLLCIAYQAMWKESVAGLARAGLFIDGNQTKVAGQAGLYAGAAAATNSATADRYTPLAAFAGGLCSVKQGTAHPGDVTTGQALGVFAETGSFSAVAEFSGAVYSLAAPGFYGGFWIGFAAAGSHDVSVQFKASAGSVTVKNRKLWVWTLGF